MLYTKVSVFIANHQEIFHISGDIDICFQRSNEKKKIEAFADVVFNPSLKEHVKSNVLYLFKYSVSCERFLNNFNDFYS